MGSSAHPAVRSERRARRAGRTVAAWAAVLVAVAPVTIAARTAGAHPAAQGPAPGTVVPTGGSSAYDWATFHGSPSLTGDAPNSTLSSSSAASLGVGWATDLYGAALDSPVVAYDAALGETLAYVGTENGDLEAVDVATGQVVWGTWVGGAIRSTPAVSGGAVWFATVDSPRVYKLDATTGKVDCYVAAPQPIEGTPVIADPPGGVPTVYVGSNDSSSAAGPMLAIAASDCSVEWSFTSYGTRAGNWTACSYGVDAAGVPLIVFGTSDPDSTVYALDAVTGAEVWTYAVYNPPPGVYDVGAGALISPPGANGIADGAVYVPSKYGVMYALDLTTGSLIWSTDFDQVAGYSGEGGRSTAALDGDNLVFGYGQGLFDLDAATGAVIWQYVDPTKAEALSSPAIAGVPGQEVVAVGDLSGSLDVVSLATGTQLFRYRTAGYIVASPAVTDGNLLVSSADGFLYDFVAGGGDETTLPSTTVSAPARSAVLANPGGDLTVQGSASDLTGISGVSVAVQEGGPTGPWWDGASGTWSSGPVANAAALASPGSTSSGWAFAFPVPPAGGTYSVVASTQSAGGQSDVHPPDVGFSVLGTTKGPHMKASPAYVPPGASVTVTGSGFQVAEHISIELRTTVLATVTATSKGTISATKVKIPTSTPFGLTTLTAVGSSSGRVAAAGITVANAWDQVGYGPNHAGFEPNDPTLFDLVHPGDNIFVQPSWNYQTGSSVATSPAVADGVAYIADDTGQLFALDISNGVDLWTWSTAGKAAIGGSAAVDPVGRLVFVGADDGTLDAVSTATGKLAWSGDVGGHVSAPVVSNGMVYVTSTTGALEAVKESTGAVQWTTTLGSPSDAAPALDPASKLLVVGEQDGTVQEFGAATGTPGWSFAAAGTVSAAPAIDGGVVYAGSGSDQLYALKESTGAKLWSFTTAGAVGDTPALTNQLVPGGALELVVGDSAGDLYFLQASNAAVNYELHLGAAVTGVAAVKGVAVAELSDGVVTTARTYTDLDTWKFHTSAGLSTAPVVDDGAIYVGAGDGNLYAFTSYGQPPQ